MSEGDNIKVRRFNANRRTFCALRYPTTGIVQLARAYEAIIAA